MYLCAKGIDVASFYDLNTLHLILELFRQLYEPKLPLFIK